MKYSVVKTFAVVACVLTFALPVFAQGLYWQSKTTGMGDERTSETWAIPKKIKMMQTGKDQIVSIIRLDKEVMWQLNPAKKTYTEITFAQMEDMANKAGGKMDAAKAKMAEEMKDMTPEQRQMVEKMMGDRMGGAGSGAAAPVMVKNTGEHKTISGYSTTKYTVNQGDQTMMTLWVTKDIKGFDEMRADWQAFSRRMAAMAPQGRGMAEAFKDVDGFPVETDMGHGMTTIVTKVERRAAPASEFEIPSGYTKARSEMDDAMEKMDKDDND